MSEYIDNWKGEADLSVNPWFLNEADDIFSKFGFPIGRRRKALVGLLKVFPPEVCRRLRDSIEARKSDAFTDLFLLFVPGLWPGIVCPLFQVGEDIVDSEIDDESVFRRLRTNEHFCSTAFEVKVLANLKRAEIEVCRLIETRGRKTPDFLVSLNHNRFSVEVKKCNASSLNRVSRELKEIIGHSLDTFEGLRIDIVGSDWLRDFSMETANHAGLMNQKDKILVAFKSAHDELRKNGGLPGSYEAPPYGRLLAREAETLGQLCSDPFPELPEEKKANRVVRQISSAVKQFSDYPGIVVVGVFGEADHFLVAHALDEYRQTSSQKFSRCHMVVLVDYVRDLKSGKTVRAYTAIQGTTYRKLNRNHLKLAEILASSSTEKARCLPSLVQSGQTVPISTARECTIREKLGEAKVEPGKTITFDLFPKRTRR